MPKKVMMDKEAGRSYDLYLEQSNIRFSTVQWAAMALVISMVSGAMLFLLGQAASIIVVIPILVLIIFFGVPIMLKQKRDNEIEEALSDVFEELATSLRAGATIEQALVDLTKLQKGPLIDELKLALKDMEGGLSFEEAVQNLMYRVDIPILKRTLGIVVDGRKAGGELADILDAVSSDARGISRLQRERISKTMMYTIFIFAAGAAIAPIIFAFVSEISNIVVSLGAQANPMLVYAFGLEISLLWLYLLIECMISGIMVAVVRGDRFWRGILLYSSTMVVIATVVFEVVRYLAAGIIAA